MSYCRVHLVIAPRRVGVVEVWWTNPLYRGTDLRHRTIRGWECVVDDRTDGTSGRDEKDVGVHSCNCGVAEKSATRMATPQVTQSDDLVDPLPALERAVAERPNDARALVALANHYWLIGAGSEPVGDLASRAIASDADNRAAWHLWALAESNPRERVARWQQVSTRFPQDQLAKANLADNAAALAGAEHDYQAGDLAIDMYGAAHAVADQPDQRTALEQAIKTLKGWNF